jgi:FkbM family methyltransferase
MTFRLRSLIDAVRPRGATPGFVPLSSRIDPEMLLPAEALMRLGSAYGGWILPRKSGLGPSSLCYLVGAGEDISFDCALVRTYGCTVRIVDPTPRAIRHFAELSQTVADRRRFPINNSTTDHYDVTADDLVRMRYLPVGLADRDVEMKFYLPKNPSHVSCSTVNLQKTDQWFVAQCYRLSTLMSQQGDVAIDLLKMDIEGGEYAVIRDLVTSGEMPRLLLIEFDEASSLPDRTAQQRIDSHVELLIDAGMRCVAVDGCNATFAKE